MGRVLRRMFDEMNEGRLNGALDAVDDDVLDHLRGLNTRRAKAVLQLAADYTLADGRGDMTVADVDEALLIVNANRSERRPAGFINRACV